MIGIWKCRLMTAQVEGFPRWVSIRCCYFTHLSPGSINSLTIIEIVFHAFLNHRASRISCKKCYRSWPMSRERLESAISQAFFFSFIDIFVISFLIMIDMFLFDNDRYVKKAKRGWLPVL